MTAELPRHGSKVLSDRSSLVGKEWFPMSTVRIGNRLVGDEQPCFVIAELGINHNGDIDPAKRLLSVAQATRSNTEKNQKRTVNVVYSAEDLAKPRENPFGPTNGDLKYGLE